MQHHVKERLVLKLVWLKKIYQKINGKQKNLYADTVYSIRCANAVSSAEDTVTVFINTLSPSSQCSDGIDNDSDGQTDYPEDAGCSDSSGSDESSPVCGNTMRKRGKFL